MRLTRWHMIVGGRMGLSVAALALAACADSHRPECGEATDGAVPCLDCPMTSTYEFLDADGFEPPNPGAPGPVPAPTPPPRGINSSLRPETGALGIRSWWLESPEDARITASFATSTTNLTGHDTLTLYAAVNGELVRFANVAAGPDRWVERLPLEVPPDGVVTVTLRIEPAALPEGMNTLHLFSALETPGARVEYQSWVFPVLSVFVGTKAAVPIETHEEEVTLREQPWLEHSSVIATLGHMAPGVGISVVPDRLDDVVREGLFVQVQVGDGLRDCGLSNRHAYFALLDGVPVPVRPDGGEMLRLTIPPGRRFEVPLELPLADLPRESGHRLVIWGLSGIGHPQEDDAGRISLRRGGGGALAQIVW